MKGSLITLAALCVCETAIAQVGKVGINTTTPQAMLHVKDSGVIFTGASIFPGGTANPPVSGSGSRLMWYPERAAFRVGHLDIDGQHPNSWNRDSIGVCSFAAGRNTKAIGINSVAMGDGTKASGAHSIAMGNGSNATGFMSVVLGQVSHAVGAYSMSIGLGALARGESSNAFSGSIASGDYSTSIGPGITSRAYASLSIGRNNDSISSSSATSWVATDPVFIIGNGTDNNNRSNAFIVFKNGNTTVVGEVNRPSTSTANLVPICYGSVSNTGVINSGTSNFTVTKTGTGQYEISISGETYSNSGFTSSATALVLSTPRMVTTSASAGGSLIVKVWDGSVSPIVAIDSGFHFIVYKQ